MSAAGVGVHELREADIERMFNEDGGVYLPASNFRLSSTLRGFKETNLPASVKISHLCGSSVIQGVKSS